MQAKIFNIQRCSTHDGRGIRTMIFYKGCPLSCQWCCNPESQSYDFSLMYNNRLCKNFGDCLNTRSKEITSGKEGIIIDRSSMKNPEIYRDLCTSRALTVSGEEKSITDLLAEIDKDVPFYNRSDGGVTLSGGEPLSQGVELENLLEALKIRKIDVAIETSLHVDWERIERCILLAGTFLVDLKHTDEEKFKEFTGGDATLVLKNLAKLSELHSNVIIRIPVIPGFNHTAQEMKRIIDVAASLNSIREIHFLPFHVLGIEKYRMLGMEYVYPYRTQLNVEELTGYVSYAESVGLITKIGG